LSPNVGVRYAETVPSQGSHKGPGDPNALDPEFVDVVDEDVTLTGTERDGNPLIDATFRDDATAEDHTLQGDIGTVGSLRRTPAAKVVFEMYASNVTGALLFSQGDKKKIVYLRSGYPISVKSNVIAECLGKILLWDGRITEDQWRESLVLMRRSSKRQGSVLIQMGALTPLQLAQGLSLQARFKLCETFSWEDGRYRLWPGVVPPAELTSLDLSPATIIHEGVRSFMPHKRVLDELRPFTRRYLHPNVNPLWRFQELRISHDEEALLERIDGTATVEELLRTAPIPVPEASALLYTVLCTEMATPHQSPRKHRNSLKNVTSGPFKSAVTLSTTPRVSMARLVERLRSVSYHEVLGVPDDAPQPTLHLAYHQRALERHPDRLGAGKGEGLRSLAVEALTLTAEAFNALSRIDDFEEDDQTSPEHEAATVELSRLSSTDMSQLGGRGEGEINDRVQRIISAERHHQQGLELLDKGQFADAARALARAVSACDEEGEFRASLAWAVFQAGLDVDSAKEALEHLDEAIIKSPSARAYLFRGHVLRLLDRDEDAIWSYPEALRKEPDNEVAQSELERIYEDRQERGE